MWRTIFFVFTILYTTTAVFELCFLHGFPDKPYFICGDYKVTENTTWKERPPVYHLKIGWNASVPTLDYGLFAKFHHLTSLHLEEANIEALSPRAFYGLERLEELSLYGNKLTKIAPRAFSQLHLLRALDLSQNLLEEIGDDAFNVQLRNLTVQWNNIRAVRKEVFYGLSDLLLLSLKGNKIESLPANVFEELVSLEVLDLSYNRLKELPEEVLWKQANLASLSLSYNSLEGVPGGLLGKTKRLQMLDLSNNLLVKLEEDVFAETELEILNVERNELMTLNASKLLVYNEYVSEVFLDYNPWVCSSLENTILEFQRSQVYFEKGSEMNAANVEGIACVNSTLFN